MRACYSAPCKFFADDLLPDNRINWYFVPDDTPIYDGTTVFWPRSDVPPDQATSAFESEGFGRDVRTHTLGTDVYGRAGDHVHGDADDFAGNSLRKKYYIDDVPPEQPCPVPVFPCVCADMLTDHPTFSLRMHSPDYPELDGFDMDMVLGSHIGGTGWRNELPVIDFHQFQGDLQVTDGVDGCTLQFHWLWVRQDPVTFEFELFSGVTTAVAVYDCHAFIWDASGEILNFGVPTGKFLRFTIG